MRRLSIYRDKDGNIKAKMSNKRQIIINQPSSMCTIEQVQTHTCAKNPVKAHKLPSELVPAGVNPKCKASAKKRAQMRSLARAQARSRSQVNTRTIVRTAVRSPINNDFNNLKPVKYDTVEKNLKEATHLALSLIKR